MSEQYTPDPFGYFKPEPFGWTDCAESDDDAIPLYDKVAIKLIEKQRDKLSAEVEAMKLIIATDTGTESAVAAMQKQRDELLAALESILPEFRQHSLRNLRDDETSENHRCRVFDHDDHLYEIANKVIAS